jgi:hypothetical protein
VRRAGSLVSEGDAGAGVELSADFGDRGDGSDV